MERKLTFKDKELIYDTNYSSSYNYRYKWDGFGNDAIINFKPNLHKEIMAFIEKDQLKVNKIINDKKAKELESQRLATNERLIAFQKQAQKHEKIKDSFEVVIELAKKGEDLYAFKNPVLRLKKIGDIKTVGYLTIDNCYTKKYEVYIDGGKTTRYSTFQNALKKYVMRYEERIVELQEEADKEKAIENKEVIIKEFCENNKLEYSKDWHSYNRYGGRYTPEGYYNYSGYKRGLKVRLSTEKDKLVILSVTLDSPSQDDLDKIIKMHKEQSKQDS